MAAPEHHDGPFVQGGGKPGFLSRLLRGGGSDPTAPHAHQEPSTRSVHGTGPDPGRRSSPPTGSPVSMPGAPYDPGSSRGRARETRGGFNPFTFLFRMFGWRAVVLVAVLVLSAVDSARDKVTSFDFDGFGDPATTISTPEPAPFPDLTTKVDRGQYHLEVVRVQGLDVTFADDAGTQLGMRAKTAADATRLRGLTGKRVLVFWEADAGRTYVSAFVEQPDAPLTPTPPSAPGESTGTFEGAS